MVKREKSMVVRLSKKERAALDRLAAEWGTPRADVLRWGLRTLINDIPKQFTGRESRQGQKKHAGKVA
jgi:hypothetical protein